MCNFFSAVVSRTGRVYHLGEIVSHEKAVEKFKLKDKDGHICRVEITPKKDIDYLKPVNEKYWNFQIDEDKPNWWEQKHEDRCWKAFSDWMKSNKGKQFRRKMKKIMVWADGMKAKNGEQHVHATRLTKKTQELIKAYYKKSDSIWASVRASVWDSIWDSIWASAWDSVWASVRASVWDSIWASVRASVWDSIWDSIWASAWDSVRASVRASVLFSLGTFLGNKDVIKIKLPADIFKAGVVHAKINDEIWVWGRKGKLLKKWKVKD